MQVTGTIDGTAPLFYQSVCPINCAHLLLVSIFVGNCTGDSFWLASAEVVIHSLLMPRGSIVHKFPSVLWHGWLPVSFRVHCSEPDPTSSTNSKQEGHKTPSRYSNGSNNLNRHHFQINQPYLPGNTNVHTHIIHDSLAYIRKIVLIGDWGHLQTLNLTSDDLQSYIVVNVSLTLTNNTIWFVAALSLIVDIRTYVQMYVRTDGRTFLLGLLGHLGADDLKMRCHFSGQRREWLDECMALSNKTSRVPSKRWMT